jgi:hypothetical protein
MTKTKREKIIEAILELQPGVVANSFYLRLAMAGEHELIDKLISTARSVAPLDQLAKRRQHGGD